MAPEAIQGLMHQWTEAISRFRRGSQERDLYVVLPRGSKEPPPVVFSTEESARTHLRYLRRHREEAGEPPPGGGVIRVRVDPPPEERPGAWTVTIDREGRPLGPAAFSLSHRPGDPPLELDFRDEVGTIRGVRDFVGYGLSPAKARESADRVRRRALAREEAGEEGGGPS